MATLDQKILLAHARGDGNRLAGLYLQAANEKQLLGNIDATCFFLTQAYVFALEAGSDLVPEINCRLVEQGREEPLKDW